MKVYVVTSGEYSDYHIDAIFTKEFKANIYANLNSDRRVEIYDADSESIMFNPKKNVYRVVYDIVEDKITSMYPTTDDYNEEDYVSDISMKDFYLYVYPSKRMFEDMSAHAWSSNLLLKVVRDRFAKYCAEHETSREELIREKHKREADFYRNIGIESTASSISWKPFAEADANCKVILDDLIKSGVKLPTSKDLHGMYHAIVKEVIKKHDEG